MLFVLMFVVRGGVTGLEVFRVYTAWGFAFGDLALFGCFECFGG